MSTHHIAKGTPVQHRRWADIFGVVTHVSSIDGTYTVLWHTGEDNDGWTADELVVIPKLHAMPERNTQIRRRVGTDVIERNVGGGYVTRIVRFDGEVARNAFGNRYGWLFPKAGGSLLFV